MGSYIAFGVWYRRILILASVKQSDGLRVFPALALPAHRRFLSVLQLLGDKKTSPLGTETPLFTQCDHVRVMNTVIIMLYSFLFNIFLSWNELFLVRCKKPNLLYNKD